MHKLTAMILASAFALNYAPFALAAETTMATDTAVNAHDHAEHDKAHPHFNPFANLNLTEQQRTQIKALWKNPASRQDGNVMKQQRDDLHALVASNYFDEAKVRSHIDQITQQQSTHMFERARVENKIYNLLTTEQKKQFNENYQKHIKKLAEHHKH